MVAQTQSDAGDVELEPNTIPPSEYESEREPSNSSFSEESELELKSGVDYRDNPVTKEVYLTRSKFNLITLALGLTLAIFDLGSDIWVAGAYLRNQRYVMFSITIGIVGVAGLISWIRFLTNWFGTDAKQEYIKIYLKYISFPTNILMYFPSLQNIGMSFYMLFVEWNPEAFYAAVINLNASNEEESNSAKEIDRKNATFHIVRNYLIEIASIYCLEETIFEAFAQSVVQIYFLVASLIEGSSLDVWATMFSIITSVASLSSTGRRIYVQNLTHVVLSIKSATYIMYKVPIMILVSLNGLSLLRFYTRTVVITVGQILLLLGIQQYLDLVPSFFSSLFIIIIPRIILLSLRRRFDKRRYEDGFQRFIESFIYDKEEDKDKSTIGKIWKYYLIIEPVLYIGFWIISYFSSQIFNQNVLTDSKSIYILLIFLTVSYTFHVLIEHFGLSYAENLFEMWNRDDYFISSSESILSLSKDQSEKFIEKLDTLFPLLFHGLKRFYVYGPLGLNKSPGEITDAIINFYQESWPKFSDKLILETEIHRNSRGISILIEYIMLRGAYLKLMSNDWVDKIELDEYLLNYFSLIENSKYKEILENRGNYCYTSDSRQIFLITRILFSALSRDKLPKLIVNPEDNTYSFEI